MTTPRSIQRVAILGSKRIPFVKSSTVYDEISNQELLTTVLNGVVEGYGLKGERLGEVVAGALLKKPAEHSLTRESVLGSGLDPHTPAFDLQRACGTSLESIVSVGNKIALSQIQVGIGAGTDTNSDVPLLTSKNLTRALVRSRRAHNLKGQWNAWREFRPTDLWPEMPQLAEPRTGLSMGQHCELMAKEWRIAREDQDKLAYESHKKGAKAYEDGFYRDLILPFKGIDRDTILRSETTLEKLSKLKPAFDRSETGTLTAGNSTPLTDGASAVLLGSEKFAASKNLQPLAYLVDAESAAVDFVGGEGLLMAPTYAVARLLERNGLTLQDFDYYEIHEAFAAQVLCTLKAWRSDEYCKTRLGLSQALGPIDMKKLNVMGSSLALGHPFAATGARIVGSLAKLLSQKPGGRGLISICTAGGMGVAAILES